MMGKPPAFQFYVRDWLADPQLRQASPASRGIWIDCLCYMWESTERGTLTGTVTGLCRLLGVDEVEFETFLADVEALGFASLLRHGVTGRDAKVTLENRRMSREAKNRKSHAVRQLRYRRKNSDSGRDAGCDAKMTPPSSSSSSKREEKSKNKNPPVAPPTTHDISPKLTKQAARSSTSLSVAQKIKFDRFWDAYPRKVGKGAAVKAWRQLRPDDELVERMITAIQRQRESEQWTRDAGRYIPNPATWLNQERWEDDVGTAVDDVFERAKRAYEQEEKI